MFPALRFKALAASLLVLVLVSGCVWQERYTFHGGELDPAYAAAALDLTDQFGNPFSLSDIENEVSVIYFGYTTCPDLCPTTLSDFSVIKESLGEKSERVNFILATVDPERDTPERLKEYLRFFDEDLIGLTGDSETVLDVMREYGVFAKKVEHPESSTGYLVDHTSFIYVIDADGNLRLTYPYGIDPESIEEDIRHLL